MAIISGTVLEVFWTGVPAFMVTVKEYAETRRYFQVEPSSRSRVLIRPTISVMRQKGIGIAVNEGIIVSVVVNLWGTFPMGPALMRANGPAFRFDG
jgi:hypothetical protein